MTKQTFSNSHSKSIQRTPYEQTQLARYGVVRHDLLNNPDAPVEYITGVCEAAELEFTVNPSVLIPRIETEELVFKILSSRLLNHSEQINILDVGTGSGFLGIAVAYHLSKKYPKLILKLTFTDISKEALQVTQQNTQKILGYNSNITYSCVYSNLLNQVPQNNYHIILANLPYIPSQRIPALKASVTKFEPNLALDGGPSGLDLIHQLLEAVPAYLDIQRTNQPANHTIWLEIDHTHNAHSILDISSEIKQNYHYRITIHPDSFGKNRFAEITISTADAD